MTGLRPVFRLLIVWVVAALTLLLSDWLLPAFTSTEQRRRSSPPPCWVC